mmetsp:Transcript_26956/g.88503  ORF Transcript_26956/g.88503 Transcript_26956/m.88503 type:complete len:349 (+) Transcript_26956:1849-2895(+)
MRSRSAPASRRAAARASCTAPWPTTRRRRGRPAPAARSCARGAAVAARSAGECGPPRPSFPRLLGTRTCPPTLSCWKRQARPSSRTRPRCCGVARARGSGIAPRSASACPSPPFVSRCTRGPSLRERGARAAARALPSRFCTPSTSRCSSARRRGTLRAPASPSAYPQRRLASSSRATGTRRRCPRTCSRCCGRRDRCSRMRSALPPSRRWWSGSLRTRIRPPLIRSPTKLGRTCCSASPPRRRSSSPLFAPSGCLSSFASPPTPSRVGRPPTSSSLAISTPPALWTHTRSSWARSLRTGPRRPGCRPRRRSSRRWRTWAGGRCSVRSRTQTRRRPTRLSGSRSCSAS